MEAYPTRQPGSFSASSPPHQLASATAAHIIDANGKGSAAIQGEGACCGEWGAPKAQRQQHKDQFKSRPKRDGSHLPPHTCPLLPGSQDTSGGIGAVNYLLVNNDLLPHPDGHMATM